MYTHVNKVDVYKFNDLNSAKHFKNQTTFCSLKRYLIRIDAALAMLIVNKINWTSLDVCVSADTLNKGVGIFVIFVDAITLSNTERFCRANSCGGRPGSGRCRFS